METDELKDLLFTFDGRVTRATWWGVWIGGRLVVFLAWGIAYLFAGALAWFLYSVLAIVLVVATVAVFIKRWHDRGRSGWFVLVGLIPVVGWIWEVVELGFLAGDEDTNRFGPNPLSHR